MVDVKKIKALMGANDHTRTWLANQLGVTSTTLSNKLNNTTAFKVNELKTIAEIYKLKVDELYE